MTSFPLPMFFVHIDKTGGLSIIEVLRKYFEPNEICAHTPNKAWLPGDLPGYKLYAGHFTYDFFTGQGGTKLIMMRHPVARIVSLYDFYRSHRPEYLATVQPRLPGPALARSGNLTNFLHTTDPDVIEPSSNTVAHRLLGYRYYELMPDEDAVIAESIRQLRDFAWVGITGSAVAPTLIAVLAEQVFGGGQEALGLALSGAGGALSTIGGLSLLVVSWQLRRRDTGAVRVAAA